MFASDWLRGGLIATLLGGSLPAAVAQEPPEAEAATEVVRESEVLDQATLDRAESLFFEGLAHYRAERFEEAATAFQKAHLLTKHRDMLFNIARSRERMGDKLAAVDWYRAYLGTQPADETAIIHRIRQIGGDPTPTAAVPKRVRSTQTPEGPLIIEEGPGPWPWVALGASVVAFGAGAAFGMSALDEADAARSAELRQDASSHKDSAESNALLADVAFGAGAVALGAAVYLWLRADAAADDPAGQIQVGATQGGAQLGYGFSF